MGSLAGKRALVTGAGHGIGHAVAEALLAAGCDVAAHFRSEVQGRLQETADKWNRRAQYFRADLCKESEAKGCVASAWDFLGGIDILVNNVGGLVQRRRLGELDADFWRRVIDINLTTMMHVTREAAPHLERAMGASIVNVSSLAGRKGGHPGSLVYSTTKGAVLTWTRALSNELGPKGVRVNAVAPGLILGTKFHDTFTTKESADDTIRGIPLGRAGRVEDVARAVVFLAGEYDGFINGATLDINGGVYAA